MAQSIVALENLTALRITFRYMSSISDNDAIPFAKLRALEHLAIKSGTFRGLRSGEGKVLQTILARSLSTLRSLDIGTSFLGSNFLEKFEDRIQVHDGEALQQPHYFTALKSLTLAGHCWEGDGALLWTDLNNSIDFLQLRDLSLSLPRDGKVTLFRHLEDLFGKADKRSVKLRSLSLEMHAAEPNVAASEEVLEGIYRFIASFDTLTSLILYEHNIFHFHSVGNPGVSERLQQVVIAHKNLESLKFIYHGVPDSLDDIYRPRTPYFSAEAVEIFTKNLPRLRVLELPPEDKDLVSNHLSFR